MIFCHSASMEMSSYITSRNPGLCVYAGSNSLISEMEKLEATELLLKSATLDSTESNRKSASDIVQVGFESNQQLITLKPFSRYYAFCLLLSSKLVHSSPSLGILKTIWPFMHRIKLNCLVKSLCSLMITTSGQYTPHGK
jgi:hypothetical protein